MPVLAAVFRSLVTVSAITAAAVLVALSFENQGYVPAASTALLLLYMFVTERSGVVWLSFFVFYILEFLTLEPFGLLLFAGTMSILFAYQLFATIITNKSWYAYLVLLVATRLCYYVLATIAMLVASLVLRQPPVFAPGAVGSGLRELFATLLFGAVLALLFHLYEKRARRAMPHP
jgi:cell shape-determining protein MreD